MKIRLDKFRRFSNLVPKRLGARPWLSLIVLLPGGVMTGTAFVTDWRQLVACRLRLRTLESGFFLVVEGFMPS